MKTVGKYYRLKNQYFLKDKKALIHRVVSVSTGYSTQKYQVPTTESELWCYATQLRQETVFEAASYGKDETRMFVFSRKTVVELYNLILYRGEWYEVTRVDTTDDYDGDVFVYVKDCPKGSTPKADTLRPYGWNGGG